MPNKKVRKPKMPASRSSKRNSFGMAVIALFLNMLVLPGIGTLVAGKLKTGSWQIFLWLVGAIAVSFAYYYSITVLYVGSPLVIATWIWGIMTGVKMIQESFN